MADAKPPVESEASAPKPEAPKADIPKFDPKASTKPLKPPNPIWKYLGFGANFRPKMPSRNWTIFLSTVTVITGAIMYDKRETRRAQIKWAKLVSHLAKEPLDSRQLPRKLTVYLEAPPTDGLRISQDHFKEYVKPVLIQSGLDWEFIQGRKEGDVRAELAENIRKHRLMEEHQIEEDDPVMLARAGNGSLPYEGPGGDIIIGRHTWKEYVRGLHEGWLGPLTEPPKPVVETPEPAVEEEKKEEEPIETLPGITVHTSTEEAPKAPINPELKEADGKPKKPPQPRPWIATADYSSAPLPANTPQEFDPSAPIAFPHILGFLNTPTRMYRFFTRRRLADDIGREVAAVILANSRPYHTTSTIPGESFAPEATGEAGAGIVNESSEQDALLKGEEKEWHKSVHTPLEDLTKERTWLENMVLDERIAGRMRRAELSAEELERAEQINREIREEEIEGWIRRNIRAGYRGAKRYFMEKEKRPGEGLVEDEN